MLRLKQVQGRYEFIRCKVTGLILTHGMFYYEDDEDGFIIDAIEYKRLKDEKKASEFNYEKLNNAQNVKEYTEILKEYEREMFLRSLFDRKLETEGNYSES